MVRAYYNEFDEGAAAWLRELMQAGLVMPGDVDERSITEVKAADLGGYARCHFFAGIAGWDYALRLAGWPADRPVWTASLPCQPFSAAGKRKGQADERHLWPVFLRLVRDGQPATCFGEQVASDDGYRWLARIRDDLEEAGYAVGAADLPACCAGAPHIRQRLFWVANANSRGYDQPAVHLRQRRPQQDLCHPSRASVAGGLADAGHFGAGGGHGTAGELDAAERSQQGQHAPADGAHGRAVRRLADAEGERESPVGRVHGRPGTERGGSLGFWSRYDLVPCRDGKARRVEPGTFPLAHGIPGRVGLLRGYGNSIVPQTASKFIRAFREVTDGL
jgi:DNA (cytosine-5)-methyltransferase 1